MPRNRGRQKEREMSATDTEQEQGTQYFEVLDSAGWAEAGGGGSAARGLYIDVLKQALASGRKYFMLSTVRGPFTGKKPASVSTALKNAQAKNPSISGIGDLKVSSRAENAEKNISGAVFIENPNGSDEDSE